MAVPLESRPDERRVQASDERDQQAAVINRHESYPLRDMSRGDVRRTRDGDASFVSRTEAAPVTNPAPSHRERMYRKIFSSSEHFPGERRHQVMPNIKICPVRHKKVKVPEDPLLTCQKQRNAELDKELLRKVDLFHVFHPPKLPPINRRLF